MSQRATSLSLPQLSSSPPKATASPPHLPNRLFAPHRPNTEIVSPDVSSLSTSAALPIAPARRRRTPRPFYDTTTSQNSESAISTSTPATHANKLEGSTSSQYSTGRLRASERRSLISAAASTFSAETTTAAAAADTTRINRLCVIPQRPVHTPTTAPTSFTALRFTSPSLSNTTTPVLSIRPPPFHTSGENVGSPLGTSGTSASQEMALEQSQQQQQRQIHLYCVGSTEDTEVTLNTHRTSLGKESDGRTPGLTHSPKSCYSCASSKSDVVLPPREVDVTQAHTGEVEEDEYNGEWTPFTQAPQQQPQDKGKTNTATATTKTTASSSVAQLLRAFLAERSPTPQASSTAAATTAVTAAPHAANTTNISDDDAQMCLTQPEMEQLYAMLRDRHTPPPPPPPPATTAAAMSPLTSSLPLPQWVVEGCDAAGQTDTAKVSSTRTQRAQSRNSSTAKAKSATSTNFGISATPGAASAAHTRRAQFPAVVFLSDEEKALGEVEQEDDPAAVSDLRKNGFSLSSYFSSSRPSSAVSSSDDDDQSVEGRYKEALKTIEEAAADCEVALQRIQDYSGNLSILVETWMHLHDNRFEEFAHAVLQRLLDTTRSYRTLFHDIDVPRQSLVIMDMIGRAVVAFTRPADLMDIMGEVGARHNLYGLHTEDFVAMRNAFLQVYGEFVDQDTYAKSVGVWKMFWKTTIEFAGSGAKSERGKTYTERRYRMWAERVKKVVRHLLPRQRSGGFHRLMHITYQRACEQHPVEMQPYHQLADLRTAHRTMEAFLRIVKRVVYAETAPVVGYNEQLSIDHLLTDLASAVAPHDVALMADAFLDACESYTQPALWDEVVRAALRELWLVYVVGYWTARRERAVDGAAQETAPSGREPFCLLFTDIEASTRLWDADPQVMGAAISHHHQVVRGLIEDFGGYEVKTVGDSFLVATNTVTQALLIAFGIQLELMTEPSAPSFRMVDSPQGAGDASCWRDDALRVRVGIHYCTDAAAVYDSVHSRFDYYGPSVNCASRVESSACGGQVLLSEEAYAHLRQEDAFAALPANRLYVEQVGKLVRAQEARGVDVVRDPQLDWIVEAVERDRAAKTVRGASAASSSRGAVMTLQSLTTATDEGLHPLKGIAEPMRLFSLLPLGLTGREFPQTRMHRMDAPNHALDNAFSLERNLSHAHSESTGEASASTSLAIPRVERRANTKFSEVGRSAAEE